MALGTVPVATGVVGDDCVRARVVIATRNMAAESRRAAALDGTHHLQLAETDVAAVGVTPSGTVIAEDVRDLQRYTGHEQVGLLDRLRRWSRDRDRQCQTIERTLDRA